MTVRVAINGFGRIGRNVFVLCMNPDAGRKLPWWQSTTGGCCGHGAFVEIRHQPWPFAWEVRQERDQLFVGDDAIRVCMNVHCNRSPGVNLALM